MPRNPIKPNEFIAGALPTIQHNSKSYYVDGRMKELRNINDFTDKLTENDIDELDMCSADLSLIAFEFYSL